MLRGYFIGLAGNFPAATTACVLAAAALLGAGPRAGGAAPSAPSAPAAAPAGARSLFDGKSLDGWTDKRGGAPGAGWSVEDGALHHTRGGGDIYYQEEFSDFELTFEWKVAARSNSGVKYRVTSFNGNLLGPEYQVLDDTGHPNGKVPRTSAGALYELFAPDPQAKPAGVAPGEWQQSRIVARGNHLEHWLNGKLVVSVDTGSPAWQAAIAASKFKAVPGFALNPKGRIMLQDHGDEVWFRKLEIRPL